MGIPCIICERGKPKIGIICKHCEASMDLRKDTYDSMVDLVFDLNKIVGLPDPRVAEDIHKKVKEVYEILCNIEAKIIDG